MTVEYLAGLFDADGCASSYVQRSKKSNKTVQVHSCEISMTNKEVVYWVKDFLGLVTYTTEQKLVVWVRNHSGDTVLHID